MPPGIEALPFKATLAPRIDSISDALSNPQDLLSSPVAAEVPLTLTVTMAAHITAISPEPRTRMGHGPSFEKILFLLRHNLILDLVAGCLRDNLFLDLLILPLVGSMLDDFLGVGIADPRQSFELVGSGGVDVKRFSSLSY